MNCSFWSNQRVLVTGHTGFKGAWLSLILREMGAQVHGVSLPPKAEPNLYSMINSGVFESEKMLDLRDRQLTSNFVKEVDPHVVFHLAAQASVLEGYEDPEGTWTSNVVSTLNILESLSTSINPVALVVATTDKVYLNKNQGVDFKENDQLGGSDPYSSSKVAVEELVISYRKVFAVRNLNVKIAVARSGNVIGGGDFMNNRIIPDVFRAIANDSSLIIRNPEATRPWQHVLDPLIGYMYLAQHLHSLNDIKFEDAFNFSNPQNFGISVGKLLSYIPAAIGLKVELDNNAKFPEAKFLNLNSDKAEAMLNWQAKIEVARAMKLTMEWYEKYLDGSDMKVETISQIRDFLKNEAC